MGPEIMPKGKSKFITKDSRTVAKPAPPKAKPKQLQRLSGHDFLMHFVQQIKEAVKVIDRPGIVPHSAYVDMSLALTYSFSALKVIDALYPNMPGRVVLNDAFRTLELLRTYTTALEYMSTKFPDLYMGKEKIDVSLRKYLQCLLPDALGNHNIHTVRTPEGDLIFIKHKVGNKEVVIDDTTKLQ